MYVHVGGSSSYDSVLDFLILFVFFSEAFSFICRGRRLGPQSLDYSAGETSKAIF